MPIQGSLSSSCSPLSPQVVTPIKPLVTLAATTTSSATFSSSILMQLNSQETKDSLPRLLHNRTEKPKDAKEPSCKTGVLQKLLNSASLPSYEEAINKHGLSQTDEKELGDVSVSKAEVQQNPASKTFNLTLARSLSQPEPEVKRKQENNQVFMESIERSTAGSDAKVISTSEYPFSYQLALLREKCLNPSGKENIKKDDNDVKGQSVQLKTAKSTENKSIHNENNVDKVDAEENSYSSSSTADSAASSSFGLRSSRANATHHHYATSRNSQVTSHPRSKTSTTTVIRPSTNAAHPRTFSSSCVPSVTSSTSTVSASGKQKQSTTSVFPTTDLPNVNYMGNAPNIDLGSILQSKQNASVGDSSSEDAGGERRRITLMQALQPTQTINEDELQSTLEILRTLDSQYFSQSDLDLDTMQPCIQPPTQHHDRSSPVPVEFGDSSGETVPHDQQGSKRSRFNRSTLQSSR